MLDRQQQVAAAQGKIKAAGLFEVHESRKGQDWIKLKLRYWGEVVMTCADVERVLPELLDGAPDRVGRTNNAAFQNAFDAHVKSCPDCSDLVSDLKLIASEAHEMAASEEPPQRVWLKIAAQL